MIKKMNLHFALRATTALASCILLASCQPSAPVKKDESADKKTADTFIADVNQRYLDIYRETNAAQWAYLTYINEDTALLASKANERMLAFTKEILAEARV